MVAAGLVAWHTGGTDTATPAGAAGGTGRDNKGTALVGVAATVAAAVDRFTAAARRSMMALSSADTNDTLTAPVAAVRTHCVTAIPHCTITLEAEATPISKIMLATAFIIANAIATTFFTAAVSGRSHTSKTSDVIQMAVMALTAQTQEMFTSNPRLRDNVAESVTSMAK